MLVFPILLFYGDCWGQSSEIKGRIIDGQTGLKIEYADIFFYKDSLKILRVNSDTSGVFTISLSSFNICKKVVVSALNYKSLIVYDLKNLRDNQGNWVFELQPLNNMLKTVEIKSTKKYRDTVRIDLSNENFDRSKMVEELFYTSGLSVDSRGQLWYKGNVVSGIKVNGKDFFGKNNMGIYKILPALTMKNIEIISTNIDSVTNTIITKPDIKLNFILKEKYNKGNFGNVNMSVGSSERYLFQGSLYLYNKNEQFSFFINSNNVNANDNIINEPVVDFSTNTNTVKYKSGKITYERTFKKLILSASLKGALTDKDYKSLTEREEQIISQKSKMSSSLKDKIFLLDEANFGIDYKMDSLSVFSFHQSLNYKNNNILDSTEYNIQKAEIRTLSQIYKKNEKGTLQLITNFKYNWRSFSKKGRTIGIQYLYKIGNYKTKEYNDILNVNAGLPGQYFINGNRNVFTKALSIESTLTEPLGDNSYFSLISAFRRNILDYHSNVESDTVINFLRDPVKINNKYIDFGGKYHKSFKKISFDASVGVNVNLRQVEFVSIPDNEVLTNLVAKVNVNYAINNRKNLSFSYNQSVDEQGVNNLTGINSSFGLVSQFKGNPYLKSEVKKRIEVTYNLKKSDSLDLSFSGGFDLYKNKLGYIVNSSSSLIQETYVDNIGNAKTTDLSFSLNRYFSNGRTLNYFIKLNYEETPVITNQELLINKSYAVNQSLSYNSGLIISILSQSSTLSASFTKYHTDAYNSNSFNITLSNKLSANVFNIKASLFPLINLSKNINSSLAYATNFELSKDIFKKLGTCWIQVYDVFNTFKYNNDFLGPTYKQTLKYSNLQRYILVGVSFKFNSMK
ncbi:outer membrane beta-barrel protein [Pedobacter sp. WC2423]|uniref:outer membrane beta-barrel protein n=1 Tax=Pedobacter sp. WC2423 TaxID=3234142 RepID=UPI00346565C7